MCGAEGGDRGVGCGKVCSESDWCMLYSDTEWRLEFLRIMVCSCVSFRYPGVDGTGQIFSACRIYLNTLLVCGFILFRIQLLPLSPLSCHLADNEPIYL